MNNTTNAMELNALRDYVRVCNGIFCQLMRDSLENVTCEDVQEYITIGKVIVQDPLDKDLLKSWFDCLCNSLRGKESEEKIVRGMECALLFVNKDIFKEDPDQLLRLCCSLLGRLNPVEANFTKETYEKHRIAFSVLHKALSLFREVSPNLLDVKSETGVYQVIRRRLKEIKKEQKYYPYLYHAKLITQGLLRLERKDVRGACKRILHGVWGSMCLSEGIRSLATLEFKPDSFEAGCINCRKALTDLVVRKQKWYDWIQHINRAALEAFHDLEKYNVFERMFDAAQLNSSSLRNKEAMAFKFGLVDQVALLVLHASNEDVRARAFQKLLDLAREVAINGGTADATTFQALLEAFLLVYGTVERKDLVEAALDNMRSCWNPTLRTAFDNWIHTHSIREKLDSSMCRRNAQETHRIFCKAKETVLLNSEQEQEPEPQVEIIQANKKSRSVLWSLMFGGLTSLLILVFFQVFYGRYGFIISEMDVA